MPYALSKSHCLTFFEGFKAIALDAAEVYEQISAAVAADESITFAFVKPFNCAVDLVRHCNFETFV